MPQSNASSVRPSPEARGRRRALVFLVNGALAAVGGALGTLLGTFALRPFRRASSHRWIRAASLVELPPGMPTARVLSVSRADGWYRERARRTVFLVRVGDGVKALSATCTHLGCQVRWDREKKRFLCPCHGGEYDARGNVLSGPPPRPLDTIDARVDAADDSVMVRV